MSKHFPKVTLSASLQNSVTHDGKFQFNLNQKTLNSSGRNPWSSSEHNNLLPGVINLESWSNNLPPSAADDETLIWWMKRSAAFLRRVALVTRRRKRRNVVSWASFFVYAPNVARFSTETQRRDSSVINAAICSAAQKEAPDLSCCDVHSFSFKRRRRF